MPASRTRSDAATRPGFRASHPPARNFLGQSSEHGFDLTWLHKCNEKASKRPLRERPLSTVTEWHQRGQTNVKKKIPGDKWNPQFSIAARFTYTRLAYFEMIQLTESQDH